MYSDTKNDVDIKILLKLSFLNTDGSSEDKRKENLNIFGLKV